MQVCESVLYGAARTVSGVSNPFLKRLFIIAFVGPMAKHCKKKRHIHLKSYKLQQWNLLHTHVHTSIDNRSLNQD